MVGLPVGWKWKSTLHSDISMQKTAENYQKRFVGKLRKGPHFGANRERSH